MSIMVLLFAEMAVASVSPVEAARSALPDDRPEVTWQATDHSWRGGSWVVFEPRVHDLPVLERRATVDVAPDARVRASTLPALSVPSLTAPRLTESEAVVYAEALAERLGEGQLWPAWGELVYQPVDDELQLAWSVHVSTASPPAQWRVSVDAASGEVLRTNKISASAGADVWSRSPLEGERTTVELANLGESDTLAGDYVVTASCVTAELGDDLFGATDCGVSEALAVSDEDGDFFFAHAPESFDDPQAEVQVYHHVDRIASWLDETYGFRHARPLRGFVNFEMANAFYGDFDGDGVGDVSFGQAEAGVDFAYDADVVYHEFGHSVVGALAAVPGLTADKAGLEWAGGSLNEGVADVFSMLLTASPSVGPYVGEAFDRSAIRELAEDRRCPDDLRGEVHRDGEILGAVAWNIMTDPRVPEGTMGDLLMGALPQWGPDISWKKAGRSFQVAADDLLEVGAMGPEAHAAVNEHLSAGNLPDCGRAIPVVLGESYDMYMMKSGLGGDLARVPLGTQFEIVVPEDASSIWFDITSEPTVGWSIFGRLGEPVGHDAFVVEGLGIGTAVPVQYDWTVDGFGPGGVRLLPGSDFPLQPGSTLYVSVSSWSGDALDFDSVFDLERITVSTRLSTAEEGVEVVPGACSSGGGLAVGWLGLAALAVARRRA